MSSRAAEKPWNARKYWSLGGFYTQDEHGARGLDLATAQLAGNGVAVDGKAVRNALEDHHERAPVRFTGSEKSHH